MKLVLAAALALSALTAGVSASSAMPLAPRTADGAGLVQDIRWGCAFGWHPNYWGRCVPDQRVYYGYPRYYGWYGRPHYYYRWHRW